MLICTEKQAVDGDDSELFGFTHPSSAWRSPQSSHTFPDDDRCQVKSPSSSQAQVSDHVWSCPACGVSVYHRLSLATWRLCALLVLRLVAAREGQFPLRKRHYDSCVWSLKAFTISNIHIWVPDVTESGLWEVEQAFDSTEIGAMPDFTHDEHGGVQQNQNPIKEVEPEREDFSMWSFLRAAGLVCGVDDPGRNIKTKRW